MAASPLFHLDAARSPSRPEGLRWIGSARQDLPLLLLTPVAIIPIVLLATKSWEEQAIVTFVAAFGATAHHLPGLLRAYGDPRLFSRYRLRLLVAPVALVTLCVTFAHLDLGGLTFVALCWGIWHGLAQTYGLGRMYDAKAGRISRLVAHLDKALCIAWFGGGFLFSSNRLGLILAELYGCGVPAIPAPLVQGAQLSWALLTASVSLAWALLHIRQRRAGVTGSRIKILLFVSSFAFWWFANIPIENGIIGIALFEIFHDVQYLTIVWIYNRKLMAKGQPLDPLSGVLFGGGTVSVLLLVAACWLYGALGPLANGVLGEAHHGTIEALVLASTLLHFYYDSFIWNVRDTTTRHDLDLGSPIPAG